jgi:hypothetical protein
VEAGVNSASRKYDASVSFSNAIHPHMAWRFEVEIVDWKNSVKYYM